MKKSFSPEAKYSLAKASREDLEEALIIFSEKKFQGLGLDRHYAKAVQKELIERGPDLELENVIKWADHYKAETDFLFKKAYN